MKDLLDFTEWALIRSWRRVDPPRRGCPRRILDRVGPWKCVRILNIIDIVGVVHKIGAAMDAVQEYVIDKGGFIDLLDNYTDNSGERRTRSDTNNSIQELSFASDEYSNYPLEDASIGYPKDASIGYPKDASISYPKDAYS